MLQTEQKHNKKTLATKEFSNVVLVQTDKRQVLQVMCM